MHIAIQTEQEEIEQILIQHYATQHGFDLKSVQWEMDQDTGKVTAISVAEPLDKHKAPSPPLRIDEDMVRRVLGEMIASGSAVPTPVSSPNPPTIEELPSLTPAATPAPAPQTQKATKPEPARTQLGHVVSWLENPEEAPHHPSDTPDKISKRRERLLRARREAGGVMGDDNAEEMFDPTSPPKWADTEKH